MSEPEQIKIEDYQIHLPPLGEGTFGTVYRVTYRGILDRAMKVFRPGAVDIVTMARELEKLSKVAQHNGIVTLHNFDLLNHPPYYTMGIHAQLMPDGTWETRTLEFLCGTIDHQEAWRLIHKVADAVSYLHQHHIVHCDLKPTNILLTDESPTQIKICDFGQSRGLSADSIEPVGTPLYAPPEQIRAPRDSAHGKGFRWDVYSFGVIAYQLLTGKLPRLQALVKTKPGSGEPAISAATQAETGNKLEVGSLADLIEADKEITWPPHLHIPASRKLLIERCLALDPAKRPADMREVWSQIQEQDRKSVINKARRLNIVFALLLTAAIGATIHAFVQAERAKAASAEAIVSGKQAEQLALIIVDEFTQGKFAGAETDKIYSIIADHSETFLDNLPKNRESQTTLRISAQVAAMRGRQALEQGNLDDALEKYQNAYKINSQLGGRALQVLAARDLKQIGTIYEKKRDFATAADYLIKARHWQLQGFREIKEYSTQNISEFSSTYLALANLYLKSGDSKKAIETLNEIAQILSEKTNELPEKQITILQTGLMPILSRLGEIQYGAKDLKGALDSFTQLYQLAAHHEKAASPTVKLAAQDYFLTATRHLGQIHLDREAKDKAILLFREEIRLRDALVTRRPYDADLKVSLADAYEKAGRCLEVEQRSLGIYYLERALSLISSLPPELRLIPENISRSETYQRQLHSLLEKDE